MWNKDKPTREGFSILLAVSRVISERIRHDIVGPELRKLVRDGNTAGLCTYALPKPESMSIADYCDARQVTALFSKNSEVSLGLDTRAIALETWLGTEEACRKTNIRIRNYLLGREVNPLHARVHSVLFAATRKIAKVLGPNVPKLKDLDLRFSPGATSCVKKKNACARTKLDARPQCSTNMMPLLTELFLTWPAYAEFHGTEEDTGEDDFVVVRTTVEIADGKLAFVPKNAKTDRTVMVEPHLNGVIQGGYGSYIRRRLLGVGIDLTDQSRNKGLAREGSLTGALATLDLSSASDLISSKLVELLLPVDWYLALSECRTPIVKMDDDSEVRLEKFSSMGNGFTFPLQSLIFWALATAAQESFDDARTVSVYGDDIIVPTKSVDLVLEVFSWCGFKINLEKSFWEGPFRESCGGDYYLGVDVRPMYVKGPLSFKTLFWLHNGFIRRGETELASAIYDLLPAEYREVTGPDGYGDGHLLREWAHRPFKRDHGWSGHLFDTFKETGERHKTPLPGDFLLPAYTIYVNHTESWDLGPNGEIRHEPSSALSFTRAGVPTFSLPGVSNYKRVTIYTLVR